MGSWRACQSCGLVCLSCRAQPAPVVHAQSHSQSSVCEDCSGVSQPMLCPAANPRVDGRAAPGAQAQAARLPGAVHSDGKKLRIVTLGFRLPAASMESSRASSPRGLLEDGLAHRADTSRSNLAAALALLSRWRLSKPRATEKNALNEEQVRVWGQATHLRGGARRMAV